MNIYNHDNLFLDNKYATWYYNIIIKAQNEQRIKLKRENQNYIYYEYHHILPKSIFKEYTNLKYNPWNGVLLTAREHFICHALLCKMVVKPYNYKMLAAFMKMSFCFTKHQQRYTSKLYEYLKIEWAKEHSIRQKNKTPSKQTRLKMSNSRKGQIWWNNGTKETRSNIKPSEDYIRGRLIDNLYKFTNREESIWYNDGLSEYLTNKPKEHYILGRLPINLSTKEKMKNTRNMFVWWNNGTKETMDKNCPDKEWRRGRLKRN